MTVRDTLPTAQHPEVDTSFDCLSLVAQSSPLLESFAFSNTTAQDYYEEADTSQDFYANNMLASIAQMRRLMTLIRQTVNVEDITE